MIKLTLLLLVTSSCAAMHKKAAPISKSAHKYAAKVVVIERSVTRKPYTEEDKPWYLKVAEEKAKQYGHDAPHASRDHYLHEGADESKS